jgi:alpha-glucosidase (family GH31 glycosyl hydrolase)
MLWNSHHGHGPGTDMAVPLLLCIGRSLAFGLFFDTTAGARLDVQRSDRGSVLLYEADAQAVDLYVLAGPSPAEVMGAYAGLTGHPPLPPRWALGYLQSTRHWDGPDEIRDLAQTIRERRIPCDALVFLSTYGEAKSWNVGVGHLEFEPGVWPDPEGMMRELQEGLGFRVVTHEYPVLHPQAEPFAEAEGQGFLLPPAPAPASRARRPGDERGLTPVPPPNPSGRRPSQRYDEGQRSIDFSLPAAREWWWAQHRRLVDLGVAGWWLDGAEGPPAATALAGGPGRLLHNAYALLRMQAFAEGEARDRPDGRPWMLCRSGGAGMQRYGAATWSGDINTTFATFEAQVPLGLNTSLSGVPYWGTDIGGFFPAGLTGELYTRWFQFGALCPLFRSHGWVWRQHLPWAHGEEVEAVCRRFAELRMRLLPYLYTLAWRAHTHGEPLMRPLAYHYPADPNVWELGSQYLLGPDLLVAPVTRAGATHWPLYLPAGEWYDFWTHERLDGGRGVSRPAPLESLPLLVRGGAVLPCGPVQQRTDERPLDELTLLVYPPAEGQSEGQAVLYEDDGRSQAYGRGERALTTFRVRSGGGAVRLEASPAEGRYRGQPGARTVTARVWIGRPVARVEVGRGAGPSGREAETEVALRVADAGAAGAAAASAWWPEGPLVWVRVPQAEIAEALSVVVR